MSQNKISPPRRLFLNGEFYFTSERWERLSGSMVNSPECRRWSEVSDPEMSGGTDDKVIREETSAGPETDLCGPGLRQSNHNKGLAVIPIEAILS